ncbi:MAG TPA: TRAP transporter substrate-binding protein [Burkholderiales bacterium]|nr:TRAP transporter substrate-binding protein [Burkholderiales bacterium]
MKRAWAMLLSAAMLVLSGCGEQDQQEGAGGSNDVIEWKAQSLWQAGTLPHKIFEEFAQRVGERSGGRLTIEALALNSIVSSTESLDAVGAGILHAQHSGPAYFTGKDAAFALLSDPQGGFETPAQMRQWMDTGGGLALARELYARYNVFFVGGVWYGAESLVSKKPIRKLTDLQGVKIRAPQGIGQDIFQLLGAAPVNLPGSEVYTALERGVVDASDWGTLSMNQDLGYHKLAPYPLYPGYHSMPMADFAVNMSQWNKLPDDLKALVEAEVAIFATEMIERNKAADEAVLAQADELGFEAIDLPKEERRKFREMARGVWKVYAARSPMAQRIYDSQVAFLKQIDLLD